MDVLASPVSSLLLPSKHRETLHLLKSPLPPSYSNLSSSKPNPPFSLCSSSTKHLVFLSASSTPSPLQSTLAARTNHRAATGYAAALIDFSRRGGAKDLAAIARDVHRLATSIASIIADSSNVDEEREAKVRDAVESGGFDRRLVALVRMLVAKKMGVEGVADVLEEFGRIWKEMTLAVVEEVDVVVASERKMGIEQLAKVAGEVRRASGAVQVNMKHFFRRRSPSYTTLDIHAILDMTTLITTLWVVYMIRVILKSSYMEDEDNFPAQYLVLSCALMALLVHPTSSSKALINRLILAFGCNLETVAIMPQLRLMKNAKVVESLTAHYVFALGVARFLSCAHWILQVVSSRGTILLALGYGLWPGMVLLSEIVQTSILAEFCYYYIKSVIEGHSVLRLPSDTV